ncbi:MAG: helix-turn-helix transcriptional regulator [Bacteroidetes bacterium]|nr:helix-turn-helix transcriptional regulator [Bacteroidota bacterium]
MINNEIKRYRIEKGLTQKDFAKILQIDESTLGRIESGSRKNTIKIKTKLKIYNLSI